MNWDTEKSIPSKTKSGELEEVVFKTDHSLGDTAQGVMNNDKKVPYVYHHISLNLDNWNENDAFSTLRMDNFLM